MAGPPGRPLHPGCILEPWDSSGALWPLDRFAMSVASLTRSTFSNHDQCAAWVVAYGPSVTRCAGPRCDTNVTPDEQKRWKPSETDNN